MADNKTPLADAEIKKALECCPQDYPNRNCTRCAYKPIEGFCFDYLMKDALDLINRKEEMIEALIAGQETLQKALAEKNAEIERLQNECFCIANERDAIADCLNTAVEEAKAEAIKEFAERLKQEVEMISYEMCSNYQDTIDAIDETYKEMVGDADV